MTSVTLEPLPRSAVAASWPARQPDPSAAGIAGFGSARPRWPRMVAGLCFVQYVVVGVWLINVQGYTIGDANARTVSAEIMVLSRDPHLGAMGFYWPPLPMMIRIPLVLVLHPFNQVILAGPMSTALCAALVVPILAKVGRELNLGTATTAVLVGLYALNPITVFSAANGMSEAMFALVVAWLLWRLLRFWNTRAGRDLAWIGVSLGVGVVTRIEFIPIAVVVAVGCVLLVPRELRKRSVAVILVPPAFAFAMWSWSSSLIVGDALYWYHLGKVIGASVQFRPWLPPHLTPITILGYLGYMTMMMAPALVVATFVGAFAPGRRVMLVVLVAIALTVPGFVGLQLQAGVSTGEARYFVLLPLFGCVVSMWALSSIRERSFIVRRAAHVVLVVVTAVGAVVATYAHANPTRTFILRDGVFYAALVGGTQPDHIDYHKTLQPLVAVLEPQLAAGKRVVMDSHYGNAILFSRHPAQFIVPEDRDFEQIMSDPAGRFDYAIVGRIDSSGPNAVIAEAVKHVDRGHFELIVSTESADLYEYHPDNRSG